MSGILLALIAALLFAIGNICQKQGMNQLVKPKWIDFLKNGYWLLGMGLSCVAILLVYSITAKYELSLVQPILALNPILSVLFAHLLLKEKGNTHLFAALGAGFIGVVLLSQSNHVKGMQSADGGLFFTTCVFVLMYLLWQNRSFPKSFRLSILSGLGFGTATILFKVFAVTFLKSDSHWEDAVYEVFLHWSIYAYVLTYVIGFFTSQIALLNGKAMVVVPISAAVGTGTPILGGLFIFGESLDLYRVFSFLCIALSLLLFSLSLQKENKVK